MAAFATVREMEESTARITGPSRGDTVERESELGKGNEAVVGDDNEAMFAIKSSRGREGNASVKLFGGNHYPLTPLTTGLYMNLLV